MRNLLTFYYDFVSPYSYLAYTQLPDLLERTDTKIEYRPINVLEIMVAVGNTPTTATCIAKGDYAKADLTRWAMRYRVPIVPHPKFGTFSATPFLLGALSAENSGQLQNYSRAVFESIWLKQADLDSDTAIIAWLIEAGVTDAEGVWKNRHNFTSNLKEFQEEAIANGVFGVPSFVTKEKLYFGNDRLDFLEKDLLT